MGLLKEVPDDVDDPSDWQGTKLPAISELDSMLRCQICKGYLRAPVVTPCGHVFCSICIRQALDINSRCPLCQEETFDGSLRKVLLLDGIVNWFTETRPDLLEKLKSEPREPIEIEDSEGSNSSDLGGSDLVDTGSTPNTGDDVMVECPVCGDIMTATDLQRYHLDECLKTGGKKKKRRGSGTISTFFKKRTKPRAKDPTHQLQVNGSEERQKIASLDPTITISKLRSRLASYKLSTSGTRSQLEARMKEFINLYNSNLDSLAPVDDRVLISRLNKWESLSEMRNNDEGHQDAEKAQKESNEWRLKYSNDYSELVKRARANMK